MIVKHKLIDYQIKANTEILILGTFLPETIDKIDFFYGSKKNQLWELLPNVFDELSLINQPLQEKINFITKYKIDFSDLILKIKVPDDEIKNRKDSFIDNKTIEWNDIINLLLENKSIKKVFFTRKTLTDVPNIEKQINTIENFCIRKQIAFSRLITPSRAYRGEKLSQWKKAFTTTQNIQEKN